MTWIEDLVTICQGQVDDRVQEALWGRGVDDTQIKQFQLGYLAKTLPCQVPDSFSHWYEGCGPKVTDCFVLPLTNALGQVRGIQLRGVSPETKGYMDYFLAEDESIYFGLGQAAPHLWKTGEVFLVEGAFDLFPIQRVYPQVVATLTARVTSGFQRMLRRFVKKVYLSYDRDDTGAKAMATFIRNYGEDFEIAKALAWPEVTKVNGKPAKDPCDYWEAWGDERLETFLRNAILET